MVKERLTREKHFSHSVNFYLSETDPNLTMDSLQIIRAIAALFVTIGILMAIAWAIKRFGLLNGQMLNSQTKRIKINETLWLDGGKSRLMLIEFDETESLIMVGPNGTTLIEKKPKPPENAK